MLNDGTKPPTIALAPLALMPRAANIPLLKSETDREARVDVGGEAMT